MQVLLLLCLAPVAFGQLLTGELQKFTHCLGAGSHSACDSCCDTTFQNGLLAAIEKTACHAECRILDLGGGVAPQKRQLIEILACELMGEEKACQQCCENTHFPDGVLGAAEELGCHTACLILPGPTPQQKKRQLLGEAAKLAACEALLHEDPCMSCCDSTFTGLLALVEKPACHAACRLLPAPPQKRQLLDVATKLALCEAKLHEAACMQCCDESFHGLLGFAERPACHAACKILPAKRQLPQKRQLLDEAAKIAQCEATLHKSACDSCCDHSFSGLLALAEKPLCHAACRILPA